jgi:hypothetical protein
MPLIPLRVAVELTGKDRSTLTRAIESGKLSATKNEHGRYLVDPAELERVYGTLRTPALQINAVPEDAQAMQSAALARELELTREMLTQERVLREREQASFERERSSFDRERHTWEEERTFLRGMLERHTEQIKLLTDQRERAEQERRPLLARMFGRR